ncbi:MAG: NAD-dependent epimerase/dehydratase family protein [Magnetococcus sp. YQC-5]
MANVGYCGFEAKKESTMSYDESKILITGGLGFIGSNLARRLVGEGAKVTIVDNIDECHGGNYFNIRDIDPVVSVHIADIRDANIMADLIKNNDYLFNLAGQTSHLGSMENPSKDLEINVSAQLSILELCRQYNRDIKIVFTSTRQIYGKPNYLPVDEAHPINPTDINSVHKAASECYHILYNNNYGIRATVLRLTNTYGQGMRIQDDRQCFIGMWVRLLMEGRALQIYDDGTQLRDFNFVDDCVDALYLAGANDDANGKIYNLGSHEKISIKDLADMMIKINGRGACEWVSYPEKRKKIDIGDYYGNISLIMNDLNWFPKVGLQEGLTQTLDYYCKYYMNYLASSDDPKSFQWK